MDTIRINTYHSTLKLLNNFILHDPENLMAEQFSPRKVRFSSDIEDRYPADKEDQYNVSTDGDKFNAELPRSDNRTEQNGQKTFDNNMLYHHTKLKRFSSNWLRNAKGGKNLDRRASFSINKRNESGIQRLEYELSNIKSRLFDNLQEYEDLKDSFPDKHFPPDWEPQAIRNLRSKVDRLNEKIEREKNKLKMKADDKEVAKMVESLLEHCGDENISDDSDPLKNFSLNEVVDDESQQRREIINDTRLIRKIDTIGHKQVVMVPEGLKTRQKKLFLAGEIPPRTHSERESSKAALHCALSRLPPLKKRVKARKFGKLLSDDDKKRTRDNIVVIPNRRRNANGRAFVHERQKEFVTFHKKRLHEMDVSFTRTAFESYTSTH